MQTASKLRDRNLRDLALEADNEGSWAISYADMITLLLTFFLFYFSMDPGKEAANALSEAVLNAFSAQAGQGQAPSPIEDSESIGAQVTRVGQQLIVEFPGVSFFDLGKVELTAEGQKALAEFSQKFVPFAGRHILGIRAFTDGVPVSLKASGKYRDNLELSALRSVASLRVLQKSGIPLNRMRVGGYGELRGAAGAIAEIREKYRPGLREKGSSLARKIVLVIESEPKRGES